MIDRNEKTPIIGLDGRLRWLPAYMIKDLQKQGWRLVTNPRREYFPELDQTSPHYKKEEDPNQEIEELQVEVL